MVWREEPRSCSFTLHGDQFVSAVYNPNAARRGKEREGEGEKRRRNWPEPRWAQRHSAAWASNQKAKFWYSSSTPEQKTHMKLGVILVEQKRRASMRSQLLLLLLYTKEPRDPATERGSTSFSPPFSSPFTWKMKTVAKWWREAPA